VDTLAGKTAASLCPCVSGLHCPTHTFTHSFVYVVAPLANCAPGAPAPRSVPGIGHRIKSKDNRDKRVELLQR
jgi:hypothetical protein